MRSEDSRGAADGERSGLDGERSGLSGEPVRRRRRVRPAGASGDSDLGPPAAESGTDESGSAAVGAEAGPSAAGESAAGGSGAGHSGVVSQAGLGPLEVGPTAVGSAAAGTPALGPAADPLAVSPAGGPPAVSLAAAGRTAPGPAVVGQVGEGVPGAGSANLGRSGPAVLARPDGGSPHPGPTRSAGGGSTGRTAWTGTGNDGRGRHGRNQEPAASTAPITDETVTPWVTETPAAADSLPAERGLRGLVGGGSSQISPAAAMRARDAARPRPEDLARAESDLTIVRRHWSPRE
jgi:hypothetical protein